jgi:DNA-3-methyladenine glycosylase
MQRLGRRFDRAELPEDTTDLARFLVGHNLCRVMEGRLCVGRIVETESYPVGDSSSHAFIGRTKRNASMFLEAGHAYVYRIYGAWWCLNVVAGAADIGTAVLVRSLEPVIGADLMRERRGNVRLRDLARGPGRLCQAMAVDKSEDGTDLLTDDHLWLQHGDRKPAIGRSVRIGITREAERLLRFYDRKSRPFVSGPAGLIA